MVWCHVGSLILGHLSTFCLYPSKVMWIFLLHQVCSKCHDEIFLRHLQRFLSVDIEQTLGSYLVSPSSRILHWFSSRIWKILVWLRSLDDWAVEILIFENFQVQPFPHRIWKPSVLRIYAPIPIFLIDSYRYRCDILIYTNPQWGILKWGIVTSVDSSLVTKRACGGCLVDQLSNVGRWNDNNFAVLCWRNTWLDVTGFVGM